MASAGPGQASFQDRVAQAAEPFLDELADKVAAIQRPIAGNEHVRPAERAARWWQEEEGWTPEKEQQLLAGGMSAEDVGLLKYPNREVDALAFTGGDEAKAARYARDMSAKGPPAPQETAWPR